MIFELKNYVEKIFGESVISIKEIPQDASYRKYFRIMLNSNSFIGKNTVILMYSPIKYYNLENFIKIREILNKFDLLVPEIFYSDIEQGIALVEDFGLEKINNIINNSNEYKIYKLMLKNLADFHNKDQRYISEINNKNNFRNNSSYESFLQILNEEIDIFINFYSVYVNGEKFTTKDINYINYFINLILNKLKFTKIILNHADYHVDNLFLINRNNSLKIGMIDFQDAFFGMPEYDLASLLQDARRDIKFSFADEMIYFYAEKTNSKIEDVKNNYHILAIQRNIRILGVFSRKFVYDNNNSYLQYIPLVKKYIEYSMNYLNINDQKILKILDI